MKKIIINGFTADNYGSNNYSHGMEAIIFKSKDINWRAVKELPGVFLHPTMEPNELEIFALLGTKEQFDEFYKSAVSSHASKEAIKRFGMPEYDDRERWAEIHSCEEDLEHDFIPWYVYYPIKPWENDVVHDPDLWKDEEE